MNTDKSKKIIIIVIAIVAAICALCSIADYKMVYYNPWDAQYLGYLVVDYSNEDYLKESERLKSYQSTDYIPVL